MRRLRLLLVTDAVGGVWTYSLELARALRSLNIETVIAVVGPSPGAQQRDAANGFRLVDTGLPLEWLDTGPCEIARAGEALARLAQHERVDIVQVSTAALIADAEFTQPCVAVQHSCIASWWAAVKATPLDRDFEWRRDMVERGLKRAAVVVAPSIAFAAETSRIYGVEATAVHNGRSLVRTRDIPRGQFVFTAGRLWDEGKNIAVLDAAAARLSVPLQAAGPLEGPNGAETRISHVHALGALSETRLAALYAASPIYASAALYEPFGLSVLEAAQAGCALVLSDIPTHREMWSGAAIFVDARDERAFASAIGDILQNPDEREELGRLAAARATHYQPGRMARGMAELYARVADRSNKPIELAGAA